MKERKEKGRVGKKEEEGERVGGKGKTKPRNLHLLIRCHPIGLIKQKNLLFSLPFSKLSFVYM